MPYTLEEHRHRFAAWAAGRAASTRKCAFTVAKARSLLESAGIRSYVADWESSEGDFDKKHREWRGAMVAQAKAEQIGGESRCITHGIAAKLINIYLKSTIICCLKSQEQEFYKKSANIHPPIDRLLLKSLAIYETLRPINEQNPEHRWNYYAKIGWSNFCSCQYEDVIKQIRDFSKEKPLWMIEEHWIGYQGGDVP